MSDIQFYSGLHNGYEDFSNFTHAPFQATEYGQTVHFPTVEHYFHYQKAKLFGDETAKQAILNANDPLQAKRIGHTVQNFDPFVWDKVAQKHIANGMYLKFTQNPDLKQKLIDTKDATLQEANPHDSKYGVGRDGQGQNLTGKCLMRVRDPYPYIKPNPKWKAYNYNRKKFRKHGFWLSVCWDLDWAVILYITAAVSIDNPTAVDEDGDNILATLKSIIARENSFSDFDLNLTGDRENIIRQIPSFLPKERRDDLKKFLHLTLLWYKRYAPVNMTVHTHKGKTQAFWLERLLEMTQSQSNDLWVTWADVQYFFWW